MSELIVIGYEDARKARAAYDEVQKLQDDLIVDLRGLAIIDVDKDGKTHVDTPRRIVGRSAISGAIWGMLFGVLFFVPGMALLGSAAGALFGRLTQSGIDNSFRSQVQDMLEPGHSAVVMMAQKITEDKFSAAMNPFGGKVLKTSLSEQAERELADSLADAG